MKNSIPNASTKQMGFLKWYSLGQSAPRYKNTPPRYLHLAKAAIPVAALPEGAGSLRLIAGKYGEEKETAKTFTEVNVWDIAIHADEETAFAVP